MLAQLAKSEGKAQIAAALFGEHGKWIGAKVREQPVEVGAQGRTQHDLQRALAGLPGHVEHFPARGLFRPCRQPAAIDVDDQLTNRKQGEDEWGRRAAQKP